MGLTIGERIKKSCNIIDNFWDTIIDNGLHKIDTLPEELQANMKAAKICDTVRYEGDPVFTPERTMRMVYKATKISDDSVNIKGFNEVKDYRLNKFIEVSR